MNKGIVMELSESSMIVMTPDGAFEKIPKGTRNCEVGEEILFVQAKKRIKTPQIAIASGLAAAIIVCFMLVSMFKDTGPSGQVVAYVTIDINPSVEIGLDSREVVQDLHGLNADGESLVQSLKYKGRSLEAVTSDILDKAEQGALAKGEGDIIVSSTVVAEQTSVNDEAVATKVKDQINKHIKEAHPNQVQNYEVTAFAAPQEVRQEAKTNGVSPGKYAIYLNALENGVKVSLDDVKSESIHQLAKQNGGFDKIVKPDRPITKSSLQKLLEDEKSGKLNEKIQQMENEKSDKDKNGKNDGKATIKPNKPSPTKSPISTPSQDRNVKNNGNSNGNNNGNNGGKNNGQGDDAGKDSSGKPGSSEKPPGKPANSSHSTGKPSVKPSPTHKPSDKNDSDLKDSGNKDKGNKDNKDNNKDNKDNKDKS